MILMKKTGWLTIYSLATVMLGSMLLTPTGPVVAQDPTVPTMTETELERQRALEAERLRQQEQLTAEERARQERLARGETVDRTDVRRPGEWYVGGFAGYTIGHSLSSPEGLGTLTGSTFGGTGIDLANSLVYGGKVGYFLPDRLNWLGMEVEAFNTTPHIRQHPENFGEPSSEGSYLRVTTLAFNLIGRLKLGCTARREVDTHRDVREDADTAGRPAYVAYEREFCPLQPYAGVGVGLFFARARDVDGSNTDTAPGLNLLAGVRYFLTERVAIFGEYKYNRASFDFPGIDSTPGGPAGGLSGTYQASHIIGGVSMHF